MWREAALCQAGARVDLVEAWVAATIPKLLPKLQDLCPHPDQMGSEADSEVGSIVVASEVEAAAAAAAFGEGTEAAEVASAIRTATPRMALLLGHAPEAGLVAEADTTLEVGMKIVAVETPTSSPSIPALVEEGLAIVMVEIVIATASETATVMEVTAAVTNVRMMVAATTNHVSVVVTDLLTTVTKFVPYGKANQTLISNLGKYTD